MKGIGKENLYSVKRKTRTLYKKIKSHPTNKSKDLSNFKQTKSYNDDVSVNQK